MKLALLACTLLSGCTIDPFVVTKSTASGPLVIRSLGSSLLTRAKLETASLTSPDGTTMSYTRAGKTETAAPVSSAVAGAGLEVIRAAPTLIKSAGQ